MMRPKMCIRDRLKDLDEQLPQQLDWAGYDEFGGADGSFTRNGHPISAEKARLYLFDDLGAVSYTHLLRAMRLLSWWCVTEVRRGASISAIERSGQACPLSYCRQLVPLTRLGVWNVLLSVGAKPLTGSHGSLDP